MQTRIDALGRTLLVPARPQRIVSLVPSITEWLFAIGLGPRVVGVTDFCIHPHQEVAPKTKVRGTKNPDRAAIIALQPDIVLANKEENRERDVVALEAAGLAVYVTETRRVFEAIATLSMLADVLGAGPTALPLLTDMRAAHQQLTATRPDMVRRVLVPIWRDPWMAVGSETYANDLLQMCGAYNVASELQGRYPRFELDQIGRLQPDIILLPSEPYGFSPDDLPSLRSVFSGPCVFVDGELLTWYGPRIPLALQSFASIIAANP